jgi:hypothetical protein
VASCRGIYQRELRAQEDGVEGVKTIFNEYQLEIHVPVRTVYRIKYVLYMYNLGTAPNVQNWAGFAACTPRCCGYQRYVTI